MDRADIGAYRAQVRTFLEARSARFGRIKAGAFGEDADLLLGRQWLDEKQRHGFSGIAMPKAYGGAGGSPVQHTVFAEEELRFDFPTEYFAVGLSNPIPMMAAFASEADRRRLIPPALRGEHIWCQLFSEPAAGSDLAALRTLARRDRDGWRVSGQKMWTSWAQYADYGVLLVRTDPTVPKHRGLTYFYIDMRSPGIECRPIRLLNGSTQVNEVFFDDVFVPDAQRLGPVDEGFRLAVNTLMIERHSVIDPWGGGPDLQTLLDLLDNALPGDALADSALQEVVVEAAVTSRALRQIGLEAFLAVQNGKAPGPEGSITKLVAANLRQKLAQSVMDALGPEGLIVDPDKAQRRDFVVAWLGAPLKRIAGGTDQILRNTIAERILGLPRDYRPDTDAPFNTLKP